MKVEGLAVGVEEGRNIGRLGVMLMGVVVIVVEEEEEEEEKEVGKEGEEEIGAVEGVVTGGSPPINRGTVVEDCVELLGVKIGIT
jgi:hypothetical protein